MKYVLLDELETVLSTAGLNTKSVSATRLLAKVPLAGVRDTADLNSPLGRRPHFDCGFACGTEHMTPGLPGTRVVSGNGGNAPAVGPIVSQEVQDG